MRQDEEKKSEKQYASLSDSTHYVGKEACRQCHQSIYDSFSHTGMGLSFDSATEKKTSAKFSEGNIIRDKYQNLSYYPHLVNGGLAVTEFRLNNSDTIFSRRERISYIVGSGQHTNSHIINVNGYLYQAPCTYYTQSQQWDLPPGFEGGFNSRFGRKIQQECMTCHNAYPGLVEGSENKYNAVPKGIDCERCHGPASAHVKEKLSGKIVDAVNEIDYSIVNPAKLPIDRQLDVCQRCHIQGNAVVNSGKSFFDFKPGMKLSEVMNVFMPVYTTQPNEHIMASHAERMKMSKCFTSTIAAVEADKANMQTLRPYKNALTCVTCHNPHVSVRNTDDEVFNNACKNCHVQNDETKKKISESHLICSASEKELKASSFNCVQCHMPVNNTIDIPHVRVHDHYIRKPVKAKDIKAIKEFAGIACINNKNPSRETVAEAWLNYYEKFNSQPAYLDSAEKYFLKNNSEISTNDFHLLIRHAYLKNDYSSIIKYVNAQKNIDALLSKKDKLNVSAWTAYRIGEAMEATGQQLQAVKYYSVANDLAPFALDFKLKLAAAEASVNRVEDAMKHYREVITEQPKLASPYVSLGYLYLSYNKDVQLAEKYYLKALSLDPDQLQAIINLGALNLIKKDFTSAKKYAERAEKISPNNEQVKMLVKQIGLM